MASGCHKEQELVTLGAIINQPSKTYIDNRHLCWNEGDQVFVNTAAYPVSAISGSSAQIAAVAGSDSYRALFPRLVGDIRKRHRHGRHRPHHPARHAELPGR